MARWDPAWLARLHEILAGLRDVPAGEAAVVRRRLAADPVAFAVIYLRHHLVAPETGNRLSFAEPHFEWARIALTWADGPNERMGGRKAIIAPRGMGKSTWWFLILPLWATANEHLRFVTAFADAASQATGHLETMKKEMNDNALLRHDYPGLCAPARFHSGATIADRQSMIHMRNGFTFAARGIDSSVLGLKSGARRPELIILDDVEPDEATYSAALAEKRLRTIVDAIFALNIYARVVMVGTVTMPGSIMHQLVKESKGIETADWVKDEKIETHHHRPILTDDAGAQRSTWPEKWSLEWLLSREHTREYQKNYNNDPMAYAGIYWVVDDFTYGDLETCTRVGLWVDPAVTSKSTSDYTGIAVVAYSPVEKKCVIRYAAGIRLPGGELRLKIISLCETYPEISRITVEVNQGGDLWKSTFHNLPVKILTHTESESKEVRFARALTSWQRHKVLHARRLDMLEEQAVAFGKGGHDDVIDAAVSGVLRFLHPQKKVKAGQHGDSYV